MVIRQRSPFEPSTGERVFNWCMGAIAVCFFGGVALVTVVGFGSLMLKSGWCP